MAEYKGSIELISGLTQKNQGDFPLVNAKDVAVYKTVEGVTTETRLDAYLDNVGVSADDKKDIIKDATEAVFKDVRYTDLQGDVTENSESILSLNSSVKEIQETLTNFKGDNEELKLTYKEDGSILYLHTGDEVNDDPQTGNVITQTFITGGGGGAVSSYTLTLKVLDENTSFSILQGREAKINYDAELKDGEDNIITTGASVSLYVYVNDTLKQTLTRPVGKGEIDLTSLITLGNNNIRVTATFSELLESGDIITIRSTKRWAVNVIEMYITSTFDDTTVKSGAVTYNYTPYGDIEKTIYFYLDGSLLTTTVTSLSNRTLSVTIPAQAHGAHTFEVYCTGMLSETEQIESEHLYYDIMWAEEGNETPIIRALMGASLLEQYSSVPIYYSVYSLNPINTVTLSVDDKVVSTLSVDHSEQLWDYKPSDFGTKVLTIACGDVKKSFTVEIKEFPYEISPVTAGLDLDFNPVGRTNQDADYDIFYNNVEGKENAYDWTLSDNFDWVNGGWKTDEKGDSYFCVKAGTSVSFNYLLFNDSNTVAVTGESAEGGLSYTKGNGKEFKIIFKTTNAAETQATWLTCQAPTASGATVGLQMDVHNGYVKSSLETLTIPYSEEDIIEFDMNIVPASFKNNEIDYTVKDIPMILTYEDGTPVRPLVIKNASTSFKQKEAVPIVIGSEYCDVHIYRMKAYANFLTEEDIKNNFIADARSGEEIANRFLRNEIYDKVSGKLTPESVAAACPDLRVIKLSAPRFTNDKKDKVEETVIEMIHTNGDPVLDNWIATGCIHNGQGTSSNEYGYAARNLELNLKVKDHNIYRINVAVYDEDGELIPVGTVLTEAIPVYDSADPETRVELDLESVSSVSLRPGTKITLGDKSTTVKKVSLTRDSVPTNYFNVKVNVASSEHANNALLQKRYDRYLPYTSLAEVREPNVKNTMNFYNCVVFIQETNEDLTTHQEFNDTDWHFYSIGNIGDSKKTDDSRANDPDDTAEFCVEIMDWDRELSAFPADTMINANGTTEKGEYIWLKDSNLGILYEKAEDGSYFLTSDSTVDFNKTYYVDILENDDFSEDYTYGFRYLNDDEDPEQIAAAKAKWIEFYRFITRDLTTDGVEDAEKVAQWKSEFEDWFILDAALYYYLFTLRYTMVDNRAKNSFWHYGKCTDGKYRFDFWDYDNDTAFGIDNTGTLTMTYGVEDFDTDEAGAYYFRAAQSTFFVRIAKYFEEELEDYYRLTLESKNPDVFSSVSLINEFDAWQSQFPEELWRLQYERIYKRTFVGGFGKEWDNRVDPAQVKKAPDKQFLNNMMNGRKKYLLRHFERNQDVYMSSKFEGITNFSDTITLRGAGDLTNSDYVYTPDSTITITPYLNMYINLYNATDSRYYHSRCYAGEEYTVKYPKDVLDFIYIKGASYMQDLGDLSLMYLQTATLNAGTRLKQIILGNAAEGYENKALSDASNILGSGNKLLELLDLRNISSLTGILPISGIPSLKKLYAQGTSLKNITFANNGLIEEAYLPASLNELQMVNLHFLTTLKTEGYENLTSLLVENCPSVDTLTIINAAPKLTQVRLSGIDWTLENTNLLNKLLTCFDFGSDERVSSLSGTVHVPTIRATEIEAYKKAWPNLDVTYDGVQPQFLVTFKNYDGSILTEVWVDADSDCPDPIESGLISTPVKPSTAQYDFTFAGWDKALTSIISNREITATYSETIRTYTVKWYAGITSSELPLYTTEVEYGTSAMYEVATPSRSPSGITYYLFDGWDTVTTFVESDLKVTAVWQEGTVSTPDLLPQDMTPAQIASLVGRKLIPQYFKDGSYVIVPMGYMPSFDTTEEVVLAENLILNGSYYKDTGIKLFDEDKSFTLAIDLTANYVTSGAYNFIECFSQRYSKGFSLGSATTNQIPRIRWTSNYYQAIGNIAPTETNSYREICVIRHKKGDPALYVYTNDRFSTSDIEEHILGAEFTGNNLTDVTLTIGARNYEGSILNYAKGVIHYAKLWMDDLGAEECKKICSWTYGEEKFEFVDTNRYTYSNPADGGLCAASFIASSLLDRPNYVFNSSTSHAGGWGAEASVRTWLNSKVFTAMDPLWKQLIKPVSLRYLYGGNNEENEGDVLTSEYNYLYIPAYAEAFSSVEPVYLNELEEGASSYPQLGGGANNIKYLPDGTASNWWTRTPGISYSNARYGIIVNATGAAETIGYYVNNPAGICLCFSI